MSIGEGESEGDSDSESESDVGYWGGEGLP